VVQQAQQVGIGQDRICSPLHCKAQLLQVLPQQQQEFTV
jgi:hypothetical protein